MKTLLAALGFALAISSAALAAEPPITANQLSLKVEQSAVPEPPSSKKDKNKPVVKTRALLIDVSRVGNCDGNLTLKVAFVGFDVATNKKVINDETELKAEAIPGKGNRYTVTSAPFTYVPAGIDKKTKKPVPDSGTKPSGWIVRAYQNGRYVTGLSSSPELLAWIKTL